MVAIGGDKWFAWLLTMGYRVEHDYIKAHSTFDPTRSPTFQWWTKLHDDDAIVVELRRKEYNRLLEQFRIVTTAIWSKLVDAGYTQESF